MKHKSQIIDLSWTISSDMPIYPGDPLLKIEGGSHRFEDGFSLKTLKTAMHVGTHLDAPSHFLVKGGDVANIPLEQTFGFATKLSVEPINQVILTKNLEKAYNQMEKKHLKIVIDCGYAKKRNELDYYYALPNFEPSLTDFLLKYKIELIGLDMPTIQYTEGGGARAHQELLENRIIIVENLINLEKVDQEFFLMAIPLKLEGFDGSMIRAVAINHLKTF